MANNKEETVRLSIDDDEIETASKFCGLMWTSFRCILIPIWLLIFLAASAAVFFGMQAHTSAKEQAANTPVFRRRLYPDIQFQDSIWKLYSDLIVFEGEWTFLMANKTCTRMGYEVLNFYYLEQAMEFDKWVIDTLLMDSTDKNLQLWTSGRLWSKSYPNEMFFDLPFSLFSRDQLKGDGYPECYSIKGASVHDGKLDRWSFKTLYNIVLDYDKKNFRDVENMKTKACWMEPRSNNINPTLKYSFACQKRKSENETTTTTTSTTTTTQSPITGPTSPGTTTPPTTTIPTTIVTTKPSGIKTTSPLQVMTWEKPNDCNDDKYKQKYTKTINCDTDVIQITSAKYYRMEPKKHLYIWMDDRIYYKASKWCTGDVTGIVKELCHPK